MSEGVSNGVKTWVAGQLNLFRLALSFMTRLPAGRLDYSPEKMHLALRYFPAVGWLLGLQLCGVFLLTEHLSGSTVAVVVCVVVSILLTGALHEDGLADTFDGFYGGFDTERKLTIMKDSRIGTYGSAALFSALALKITLLLELANNGQVISALLVAYPLSRAMAITHGQDLPYVSAPGKSKSDPLAKPMSTGNLIFTVICGALALLLFPLVSAIAVIISVVIARILLRLWMKKHIQGFTGDCLGAAQQFQELLIYFVLVACVTQGVGQ